MKTIGLKLKILLVIFLLQSVFVFSQTKEFVRILNKELKKELKRIDKNPNAEKFEVIQFYQLRDSVIVMEEYQEDPQAVRRIMRADLKILSVEIKKKMSTPGNIIPKSKK